MIVLYSIWALSDKIHLLCRNRSLRERSIACKLNVYFQNYACIGPLYFEKIDSTDFL
jgi:hypothetical protein